MLKNVINKILLILICIPAFVFAQECTTPGIGGGASSGGGPEPGGEGCESDTCVSTGDGYYVGVRFQIYEYEGGSADNIKMIGKGVDVWGTNNLNHSNFHFSPPNTANLKYKSKCTSLTANGLDASDPYNSNIKYPYKYDDKLYTITGVHTLNFDQYSSGEYGKVYYDTNLHSRYEAHTINTWAFTHDGNKPTGGWLATNLLDKLIDGSPQKLAEVKSVFSLTDAELTRIRTNPKNIYLTAEIIYRFWNNNKWYNNYSGDYYLGTVSESGRVHGYGSLYNALYISASHDPNVGKVVPNLIKKTEPTNEGFMGLWTVTAHKAACNTAYGYAVWNLDLVCWECGDSCETSCQYASKGTQERAACAMSYCSTKEPDNANCFKACTDVKDDEGCSSTEKSCDDYRTSPVKETVNCKDVTDVDSDGYSTELSAKVCYDDKSTYDDGSDVSFTLGATVYSNTVYYKILCEEKMDISGLPYEPQTIYLSENNPGNLHFSYKVKYNRTCKLYYKASSEYRKTHTNAWVQVNNDEECKTKCKLDEDIASLRAAVVKANEMLATYREALALDPTDERLIKNIQVQEGAINYIQNVMIPNLEKTRANAKSRFNVISSAPVPETPKINEVKLKTYDYDKITEGEDTPITMIPIVCTARDTETVHKERFLCMLNGMEGTGTVTITINGVDYECHGTGGVVEGTGSTIEYEEVVIYSVPDSYVSTQVNSAGTVYHSEKDCDDAVVGANGFCKVIEFGYTFPAFDGKDIVDYVNQVNSVPDKLSLDVQGGLCDELELDFTCDYKLEAKYCSACDMYEEGSDAYIACYKEKCSCDAYCGTDMVCRAKYCPEYCEGCNWHTVEKTCTNCTSQCSQYTDTSSKEYITCFYDECCSTQCDGDCGCTYSCCVSKCDELYPSNITKNNECKQECTLNLDTCKNGGPDYLYRNISLNDPFPNRGSSTGNIGYNWFNKEKFITNTSDEGYKDNTDGFSEEYEYYIKINSKQLKQVKEIIDKNGRDEHDYKDTTSYKSFGKSNSYISRINSKAYCSKFLHEDLAQTGATVKVNYDATTKCKNIGG